jgi:hypothetical protein
MPKTLRWAPIEVRRALLDRIDRKDMPAWYVLPQMLDRNAIRRRLGV